MTVDMVAALKMYCMNAVCSKKVGNKTMRLSVSHKWDIQNQLIACRHITKGVFTRPTHYIKQHNGESLKLIFITAILCDLCKTTLWGGENTRAVASLQMASIVTFQLLTFVKLHWFKMEKGLMHQPENGRTPPMMPAPLPCAQDKFIH